MTFYWNTQGTQAQILPRAISASGDIEWSVVFDGTQDVDGVAVIANNAVSNLELAIMPPGSIKGAISSGSPVDLTPLQARTLLNVADGATANSNDAFLLARGNHTGSQLAASISDFNLAVSSNPDVVANTAKITNATHSGDVAGSDVLTISDKAVSNTKLADVSVSTLKGRITSGTGSPEDLTTTQVRTLLNVADGATANSTDNFLLARANHTGNQLASTISDFATTVTNNSAVLANTAKVTNATHSGDVVGSTVLTIADNAITTTKIADNAITTTKIADTTITGAKINNGAIATAKISNSAVTLAKIQNLNANTLIGAVTLGVPVEITCTAAGRVLLDDTTASEQRATLGLVIGVDVQAFASSLNALTLLTPSADSLPYYTGTSSGALTTLTSFARTLLDDANSTAARATLGIIDDEEGTFNPVLRTSGSSAEPTYVSRSGFYIKQGKLVAVYIVVVAGSTMTGSGSLQVHGLPFLARGLAGSVVANVRTSGLTTVTNGMADGTVNSNTTILEIGFTGVGEAISHTHIQNSSSLLINAVYPIP